MQRLARAHANCIEGLPIFGGLLGVAIIISKTDVTDPLASAGAEKRGARSRGGLAECR
nr:MAPEG family protein [Mesorhizobium japonicum]